MNEKQQFGRHSGKYLRKDSSSKATLPPCSRPRNSYVDLCPKRKTILVSKDINLRLKADALGLQAEDYETDRVFLTELYSGMFDLSMSEKDVAEFRATDEIKLPKKGN